MEDQTEIRGRTKEVKALKEFVTSKIINKESGILYLAGAPGTGKTLCTRFVLDQIPSNVPRLFLNCFRAESSSTPLRKICSLVGLKSNSRTNEVTMISQLIKKLTSDTTYIIVMDELDQLPKSKDVNLIRTIFSWPFIKKSRLVLIAIANTLNLTSRHQIVCKITGENYRNTSKILFRPYSIQAIKSILLWYLENDENFEDACVDPKALDMISMKFAREKNGDIRGALDALRSANDDHTLKKHQKSTPILSDLPAPPTPPATPPPNPCKETTNIPLLHNSIRKRQKRTQYDEGLIPLAHQVILVCILKLSAAVNSIDNEKCKKLVISILNDLGLSLIAKDDYRQMIDHLETQGLVAVKTMNRKQRIVLKADESEFIDLIKEKEKIEKLFNKYQG